MSDILDLRGLSCPIPLIKTKDALAAKDAVTVIVDEPAAKENIIKFAKAHDYQVDCSANKAEYTLVIKR